MGIDYWTIDEDSYIEPDTKVLKNLVGIKNSKELEIFEDACADASMLEVLPFITHQKIIGLDTWQEVHRLMFRDVYEWAGKIRTVRMSKGTSMFANPQFIERSAKDVFNKLARDNYLKGMTKERVATRLAFFYNELNAIHPFREGNGRSLKVIITEIAKRAGYYITWENLSFKENTAASIEGFNGNYLPFAEVFRKILKPL